MSHFHAKIKEIKIERNKNVNLPLYKHCIKDCFFQNLIKHVLTASSIWVALVIFISRYQANHMNIITTLICLEDVLKTSSADY